MSIRDREQVAAYAKPFGVQPDPANVIRGLRKQALTITAAEAGLEPTERMPNVWGVVIEFGDDAGVLSLAAFAEGTTSIYISTGGAIIGAGDWAEVRVVAAELLRVAEAHHALCAPGDWAPLPAVGRVRFHLRTFGGTVGAEASVAELEARRHPLAPVYFAGHRVVAAVDEAKAQHDRVPSGPMN